jgi:micrococcal nuclease
MITKRTYLSVLLAAMVLVVGVPLLLWATSEPDGKLVATDGDTLLRGSETIRLIGYDSPETSRARCLSEHEWGERARARLQQLIDTNQPKLEIVPCACYPGAENCNYGRSCGRLTINGEDVAAIMIRENLAREFRCGKFACPPREGWCSASERSRYRR